MSAGEDVDGMANWARWAIYVFGSACAAAVMLGSSWSLWQLGVDTNGGNPYRAALLPIALDAGALVSGVMWVAAVDTPMRRTGRAATFSLVTGSMSFNAFEVLASHRVMQPNVLIGIAVAIGVVFPLVAGVIVHIIMMTHHSGSEVARRLRAAAAKAEAKAHRAPRPAPSAPRPVAPRPAPTVPDPGEAPPPAPAETPAPAGAEQPSRPWNAKRNLTPEQEDLRASLPGSSVRAKTEALIVASYQQGRPLPAKDAARMLGTDPKTTRLIHDALAKAGRLRPELAVAANR